MVGRLQLGEVFLWLRYDFGSVIVAGLPFCADMSLRMISAAVPPRARLVWWSACGGGVGGCSRQGMHAAWWWMVDG
jgi:hypothetical protein